MKILLYYRERNSTVAYLEDALQSEIPETVEEILRSKSAAELSLHLRKAREDAFVVLLMPRDAEELRSLLSLVDLMDDVPVFLVMPDRDDQTLQLAHQFHPRFLLASGEEVTRLLVVLRRRIELMISPWQT